MSATNIRYVARIGTANDNWLMTADGTATTGDGLPSATGSWLIMPTGVYQKTATGDTGWSLGTLVAAAGTLTGTTLAPNVVTSSLTTIGTLVAGAVPASLVTAGTFATGTFAFQGLLSWTGGTFTTTITSTTAQATLGALSATQFSAFANTARGAVIMGYGSNADVSLFNRAGSAALSVVSNTNSVTLFGTVAINTASSASASVGTSPLTIVASDGYHLHVRTLSADVNIAAFANDQATHVPLNFRALSMNITAASGVVMSNALTLTDGALTVTRSAGTVAQFKRTSGMIETHSLDTDAGGTGLTWFGLNSASAAYVPLTADFSTFSFRPSGTAALSIAGGVGTVAIVGGAVSGVTDFTLSGILQLGNAYVATPQVSTGYVTMKDSTGTTYKFLVA